jgi:hypothetical protein
VFTDLTEVVLLTIPKNTGVYYAENTPARRSVAKEPPIPHQLRLGRYYVLLHSLGFYHHPA